MLKKNPHPTILLITDSVSTKTSLHKILSPDFELLVSNSKALPFFLLFEKRVDLIIIDAKTKITPAIQLCEQLRLIKKFSTIPVLLLMSKKDITMTEEAIRAGITNFLYRPLKEEQVQVALLLAKSYNKTAKKLGNKSRKLQKIAEHDPLTKIYNRWALYEMARKELAKAQRTNQPLSLLMIDFDHFKKINDQHGHLAGDSMLKHFAELLSKSLRNYDIVARFGGEEFVIILPNTSPENALLVAEKLRKKTETTPLHFEGVEIGLTISIGVACLHKDCTTLEELIQKADSCMYASKHAGRNKVSA
ncbi:MAG: diguanylate cyclase [Chlamydiota bacterium]